MYVCQGDVCVQYILDSSELELTSLILSDINLKGALFFSE